MFLKKRAHNLFAKSVVLAVKGVKTPVEKKKAVVKKETAKVAPKKVNVKETVKPEQEKVEGE